MRPAAVFDLDGTLCSGAAERFFLRRALAAGLLPPAALAAGGIAAVAAWLAGRVESPAACKRYLRGLPCAPLEAVAVHCVDGDVLPRLRPALLARLAGHRAAGDAVLLLTGTLDFLGTEVARRIAADVVVCTVLERRGGTFTGRVLGPVPYGHGKLVALSAAAAEHGFDLAVSSAYANRRSDAVHLAAVGHPFAVAPSRGLRHLADRRGWAILDVEGDARAARRGRSAG